jgi:hypothetical protein
LSTGAIHEDRLETSGLVTSTSYGALQYDDCSASKMKLGLGTSPALKNSTFEAIIVAGISDNTLASLRAAANPCLPPCNSYRNYSI